MATNKYIVSFLIKRNPVVAHMEIKTEAPNQASAEATVLQTYTPMFKKSDIIQVISCEQI